MPKIYRHCRKGTEGVIYSGKHSKTTSGAAKKLLFLETASFAFIQQLRAHPYPSFTSIKRRGLSYQHLEHLNVIVYTWEARRSSEGG
jgi:hypothetical protein